MAQYCTFYIGDTIYGMDILCIQEIIRLHDITPVPSSPDYVEGLANLRGQIVVAVNLRKLFGLPAAPSGFEPINIILRSDGEALSLIADRAGDVHDFHDEPMVPPPGLSRNPATRLIKGVFKLQDRLLHIFDADSIFETRNGLENSPLSHVA